MKRDATSLKCYRCEKMTDVLYVGLCFKCSKEITLERQEAAVKAKQAAIEERKKAVKLPLIVEEEK